MKPSFNNYFRLTFVCLVLSLVHGCASLDKSEVSTAAKPHQTEAKPPVVVKEKKTEPPRQAAPAPGYIRKNAVIVLSGEAPAYLDIAEQINSYLDDPVKVFVLSGDELLDKAILDQLEQSKSPQMIAVGLRAARALKGWDDRQIVFCQVVNHADHDLVSANMKGVGALPAPEKLFADWRQLSPQLKQVLVVTGTGFDGYMQRARTAASKHRIKLVHQIVSTDREFLYAVKRDASPTQGHWILADNRILSVKAMAEAITFNTREAIQTVVFSPELLQYGGLFYVTPSKREVSHKVLDRFMQSGSKREISGEDIVFLDSHEMGINRQVARQLGLKIPPQLQVQTNDN